MTPPRPFMPSGSLRRGDRRGLNVTNEDGPRIAARPVEVPMTRALPLGPDERPEHRGDGIAAMSVPPADNGQGPRVIDFREVNETTVMRRVPPSRAQQRVHDHKRRTGRDPAPGQLLRWRREARRARRRRIRIAVGVVLAAGAGVVAELAGWWPW